MEALEAADENALTSVSEIGPETARGILDWFHDRNIEIERVNPAA